MSTDHDLISSRWRWLWMTFAALLIGALALAAACGDDSGDDDGDGGNGEPTATEPADDGNGGDDGDGSDNGDGGDDGEDAVQRISELADNYETFQGYVSYEVSGSEDIGGLSTMAIYQEGDNSRFDIESADGSVTVITTADATYFCSEGQCIEFDLGEESPADLTEGFTELVDPDTVESDFVAEDYDYDVSSDTIAGMDATCFTATGDLDETTEGEETGEVCFSDDGGLLLRISSVAEGATYLMEATEASTSVPSGSFDPPFEVIDFDFGDIPDIGNLPDN